MPKLDFKTRIETKLSHKRYLIKSQEFLQAAQDSLVRKNWNAVGLNAVHSAISVNDVITVYQIGRRCVSEKHSDAVKLLLVAFSGNEAC